MDYIAEEPEKALSRVGGAQEEEGAGLPENAGTSWALLTSQRVLVSILRAIINCFWLSTGVRRFVFSK